jgi:hypothetical protein
MITVMDLNVCALLNYYVEAQSSNMIAFGGGAFGSNYA